MKFLFSLITLALLQFTMHAQNYELVQPGTERYFNNIQGYLKGIRIDSIKTVGNEILFFPFKLKEDFTGTRQLIRMAQAG